MAVGAVRVTGLTEFQVDGVPPASEAQFRTLRPSRSGCRSTARRGAGGRHLFQMKPNIEVQRRGEAVAQAIQTIERRVNELGVSEPVVAPYGSADDQIVVQLPGVTDVNRAKSIIRNTALLEIKLVEAGPAQR